MRCRLLSLDIHGDEELPSILIMEPTIFLQWEKRMEKSAAGAFTAAFYVLAPDMCSQ
jgi:hypothetical protein